jgi:hypothetical protein
VSVTQIAVSSQGMRHSPQGLRWWITLRLRGLLAICFAFFISGMAIAQQAPSPSAEGKVTGRAAIDKLIGNTMSGMAQGSPYFAFYDPNGTVRMQTGSDLQAGKWSIDEDNLCEEFPDDEDESCYHLELEGTSGVMTDEDGTAYKIEIIPGNPKKL